MLCRLTVFLSIFSVGMALKCYYCLYDSNTPEPPGNQIPYGEFCMDGNSLADQEHDNITLDTCSGSCVKIAAFLDGTLTGVYRTCADDQANATNVDECESETVGNVKGTTCYCTSDLCNTAAVRKYTPVLLLLSLLLPIFFKFNM